ncbi:MAG: hypothetical protein GXW85_06855 [Clostridia bacterium]|nr:hypothetical protein [Clostridia bacterium]
MRYSFLNCFNKKKETKGYKKLINKYLREGYLTVSEVEKYGRRDEKILIGLGKTRMLTKRMEDRLKEQL